MDSPNTAVRPPESPSRSTLYTGAKQGSTQRPQRSGEQVLCTEYHRWETTLRQQHRLKGMEGESHPPAQNMGRPRPEATGAKQLRQKNKTPNQMGTNESRYTTQRHHSWDLTTNTTISWIPPLHYAQIQQKQRRRERGGMWEALGGTPLTFCPLQDTKFDFSLFPTSTTCNNS